MCTANNCLLLMLCILNYSKGGAVDKYGQKIELFRDMRTILTELRQLGIIVAAASRYI